MSDQNIEESENALAAEFSSYLKSVSQEVVKPIAANIAVHQSDVQRMLEKVSETRMLAESGFEVQRQYFSECSGRLEAVFREAEKQFQLLQKQHHSLLDAERQRILGDLRNVALEAGATVEKLSSGNAAVLATIDEHQEAIQSIQKEHLEQLRHSIAAENAVLRNEFTAHASLTKKLKEDFVDSTERIAGEVKGRIDEMMMAHESTRIRLLEEVSRYGPQSVERVSLAQRELTAHVQERIETELQGFTTRMENAISRQHANRLDQMAEQIRIGLADCTVACDKRLLEIEQKADSMVLLASSMKRILLAAGITMIVIGAAALLGFGR